MSNQYGDEVVWRQRAAEALKAIEQHGSIRAASLATGIPRRALGKRYASAVKFGLTMKLPTEPLVRGRVHALARRELDLPTTGQTKRYILTCAQNNTHLHQGTWQNLKALAHKLDAEIVISRFSYDKDAYKMGNTKPGKEAKAGEKETSGMWYDPAIEPHVVDESVALAPGLIWCGEMNILPTAVRPLSGLEAYTGRKSGVIPHVKFAAETVASGKHEGTKFNYTTGTITQRNYIAKKAGLKAEFHHGYGALLAEVDSDGSWFCRQLNADSDGTIHDLDLRAESGKVESGYWTEAINWGDIHWGTVSRDTVATKWGDGGILDNLRPRFQFMHDVLDFRSRNHHDMRDPHKMFEKFCNDTDDVLEEVKAVANFLEGVSHRDFCDTIVVDSNHDNAMTRWLREADYREDPLNAIFFLEAQLAKYRAIKEKDKDFSLMEWTMLKLWIDSKFARFLRPDESFIICKDANGGIECGMHGHYGVNGARGDLRAFANMGRKSNTGHTHSPAILDGAYRAGVAGSLDQGYNVGPSSWSDTDIVTYKNGKRTLLTTWKGRWRGGMI